MISLMQAQAAAQFVSLIVFGTLARWYAAPWLKARGRADALTPLLWIHVFRYVALQAYSAQRDGFPISDGGLRDIVVGDLVGTVIALASIFALRHRLRVGLLLAWLLVVETVYDTVANIHGGVQEHLLGQAGGVTWLILSYYVPLVVVSVVLIAWQLYSRRGEGFSDVLRSVPAATTPSRASPR